MNNGPRVQSGPLQSAGQASPSPHAQPVPSPNAQRQPGPTPQRPAGQMRLRRRHLGLAVSFAVMVALPLLLAIFYLWGLAENRYSSVTGFTVRQDEGGNASEILGGLAQLTGSNYSADGEILYEFILSQSLVRAVDEKVDLIGHYSAFWSEDPIFALWPEPSIEDLEWYWGRVVQVGFDAGSGLTEVRVIAFDPKMAQSIAKEIVTRSQDMINALNEQARDDAMRYALADLEDAVARLKTAREALTAFRSRTQIVDPEADIQGRMGVMNNLQQQLAEALIEYDLLRETTNESDPRVTQANRRIEVIRTRIAAERQSFASDDPDTMMLNEDYPSLIAEYEGLVVDREFAEETYRAALAAVDLARAKASRQSRYLATYVAPTLAEDAEYPQRFTIIGLLGLFLLLSWSVMVLIYYSIRDRA